MGKVLKSIDQIADRGQREVVIPDGYTTIAKGAFRGCESLARLVIPKSVARIGKCVFAGCDSLEKIEVDPDNRRYCSVDGALYVK